MTDDPEALTQFIFRCRPRTVGADSLLDCLHLVSDAPKDRYPSNTRYALLLALGEYALDEIPDSRRAALPERLADWYRHDPSSGFHGATGWRGNGAKRTRDGRVTADRVTADSLP